MDSDFFHIFGQDFILSPGGNFETANGITLANQTVARFVLTNPGDDPYNPTWGLGARQMVGEVAAPSKIVGLIKSGMKTLDVVDQTQPVTVSATYSDQYAVAAFITYTVAGYDDPTTTNVVVS